MTVVLNKNDSLFDLEFTVKDSDDEVIDLTDISEILFKMRKPNSSTAKVSREAFVVSATDGTCKVTLLAVDVDTEGNFISELQLTFSDGKILTAVLDDVFVMSDV